MDGTTLVWDSNIYFVFKNSTLSMSSYYVWTFAIYISQILSSHCSKNYLALMVSEFMILIINSSVTAKATGLEDKTYIKYKLFPAFTFFLSRVVVASIVSINVTQSARTKYIIITSICSLDNVIKVSDSQNVIYTFVQCQIH